MRLSFSIIAGVFTYYVTKLSKDMISLAERPRLVTVTGAYGPCGNGRTDDKPFLHKHNDTYYLSWGCFYATSSSVYGPFVTQGAVISTAKIAPAFRMNNSIPPPPEGERFSSCTSSRSPRGDFFFGFRDHQRRHATQCWHPYHNGALRRNVRGRSAMGSRHRR